MSDAKYEIAFYQTRDGECQVWDFLEGLRMKAATNKDARIQHKQASLYIELLSLNGTNMNENITKHLEEDIWELRPGNNRVFYFFVQKTPLSYSINSVRSLRRLLAGKLREQSVNVMTICPERRTVNYENLERLQRTRKSSRSCHCKRHRRN